jgi:sec-independent protein translocase protein TatC
MSQIELITAVSIIGVLLVIPLIVMVVVRYTIPLDDNIGDAEDVGDPGPPLTSLRDYWEAAMPHLVELRDRLLKAFAGVIIGAMVGFWLVSDASPIGPLPKILIKHFAPGKQLEAIGVGEVFINYMGIALFVGLLIALPWVVYQILAFFLPGLTGREKRLLFTAMPFLIELFLAGVVFGWFFTVPAALDFLLNFGVDPEGVIDSKPTLDNFFGIVTRLLLWNGVIFELPAIVYLLARFGVVTTQQLKESRRYAIVVIVIAAALITPTGDPYNLMLLAIPMYLLYELGIILSRFVPKSKATAVTSNP